MTHDDLENALVKQAAARKDGPVLLVPADHDVTLFVVWPSDVLNVARVQRVEIAGAWVHVETARSERYVLPLADVSAVKVDHGEASKRDRAAGFAR